MASQVVEELTITIKVNDNEATKKLDELEDRIKKIDAASKGDGFQHLKEVAKNISAIAKAGDKLDKVASGLEKVAQSAGNTVKNLNNFNSNNIANAANSVKTMTKALSGMEDQAGSATGFSFNISGASMIKTIGKELQIAYSAGKKLASIPFKMIFAPLKGVAGVVGGIANSFKGLLHSISRVALMRGIRAMIRMITSGIKEGVDHLYLWASAVGNSFKPTMDSLAASFLYLKNSIGAAVSPLLDSLAPALETVINKIVDVINIFNQAVATLTGSSTWRKAIRSAANYSDNISGLGHEAEDANDSVKELKRTLLGFDEINRLDDKEKTTSNGSKGKDATGMYAQEGALSFTEVPVSKAVKDFVGMLKDAWGKADFTEIGSMIGNKIGTALLNVKWDKIQSGVTTLAKSVGTLINGALSYNSEGGKVMWDGIAYTIYNAINTAVLGYVTFFDTVEWDGIGEGIGAALKDVVENIHWDWMAKALSSFPNAVIDAVNGFNKQFTADDFRKTGEAIGGTIADAIIGIKWADAFNGGLTLITGLIQGINGILIGFNDKWATIKDAILLGIASVPSDTWKGLGTSIGELIFNAGNFVANMVDLLFKILKEGKWASVLNGIWIGINDSIKAAYGGWSGAALALGRWIMNNLDVIEIILAFSIGSFAIKTTAAVLAKELIKKISLLPTAEQGLTFGDWIKGISFVAGIVLLIDAFRSIMTTPIGTLKENLTSSLKNGLKTALGGAFIGFSLGGLSGAAAGGLFGLAIGVALTLWITEVMPKIDQEALDKGLSENLNAEIKSSMDMERAQPWYEEVLQTKGFEEAERQLQQKYSAVLDVTANIRNVTDSTTNKQKTLDNGTITVQEAIDNIQAGDKNTRNWTAIYNHFKGKGVTPTTIAGWIANYTGGMKGLGVIGSVISGFTANYTRGKKGLGVIGEWISDFGAYYTLGKEGDGVTPEWISGFGSVFTSRSIDWASSLWTITGFIAGITSWIANSGKKKADGGVYKNGKWYPITNFAGGGNPSSGQMFIAREAGPELVGTLNGSTAVMNNDQIVASVANGVAQAVASVLGTGSSSPIDITIKVDSETLYRSVKKGERKANGRYGTIVAVG